MEQDRKEYWEARLSSNAGLRGAGHISHSYSWNGWAYRVKARGLRRVVRKTGLDFTRSRVLDVGSGTGFAIDLWRGEGVTELAGIDITDHAVAALSQQHPTVRFSQQDIGDSVVDVPGAPFDMVSAMEVLFHITDDERYSRALRNIHDLLRPGGHFVFSDNFLRHGEHRTAHQASRHIDFIMGAVADAGFEVVTRVPMFVIMGYPVDSTSERRQKVWRSTVGRAAKSERWGSVAGFALAAAEELLTRVRSEGPTVEIMLCRRPEKAG